MQFNYFYRIILTIFTIRGVIYQKEELFFIGHSEISDSVFPFLISEIERHIIEYGVLEFIVGNYGEFDRMAFKAVKCIKNNYPNVTLSLLIPYHPSRYKLEYFEGVDDIIYPFAAQKVPQRVAIIRANRYMVGRVDYLIACVSYSAGNLYKLMKYAEKRQNLVVTNIIKQKV